MSARREYAARFAAELRANVDAMYADSVTMEEFRAANRATWDRITGLGFADDVLAVLRGDGCP